MKVVCVKQGYSFNGKFRITIGKQYDIFKSMDNGNYIKIDNLLEMPKTETRNLYIIGDNDDELYYVSEYFVTLEQHREKQLDKLGIK